MKKVTYLALRKFLLRRLLDEHCFGQKQMLLENVAKYARENKSGAEVVLHKLIVHGLVLSKKKHYGTHIWLNTKRIVEIRQILEEPD
jgi:hypothetical protein